MRIALLIAQEAVFSLQLGRFSNDDGDAEDDALLKNNLFFTFECRNSVNLFSAPIGPRTC